MGELYYSQRAARHFKENMLPVPDTFEIHSDFLYGSDREDLVEGFKQLHGIASQVYDDMAENPDEYGLPLFEIEKYRWASKEANLSGNAICRFGNLLYNIGQAGELLGDVLVVDMEKYKALGELKKVPNAQKILKRLADFGFEFCGFNGRTFDKGVSAFTVTFPDNRHVVVALKAFSAVISPQNHKNNNEISRKFYGFFHKLLTNNIPVLPQYDLADFIHILGREYSQFFLEFNNRMLSKGYTYQLDDDCGGYSGHWKLNYQYNNKYAYHFFRYQENELCLRLKLNNVSMYNDYIKTLPDTVKQGIGNHYACTHHCREVCHNRIVFAMNDEKHEACICESFQFHNLKCEDMDCYFKLLELEEEARKNKKEMK
jgi:hypothetical protein